MLVKETSSTSAECGVVPAEPIAHAEMAIVLSASTCTTCSTDDSASV